MKKTIIISAIAAAMFSNSANAKTQGHYVGLDLLRTNYETSDYFAEKHDDSNISAGINYKYAFNYNNFFVAPGVFYNHNATKINHADEGGAEYPYNSQLRYSYGAKLDLGYDLTDKFAIYASTGFQQNRMSVGTNWTDGNSQAQKSNLTSESIIFGGGVKYDISQNISLSAAYERSEYDLSKPFADIKARNNLVIEVVKLGVSYNF